MSGVGSRGGGGAAGAGRARLAILILRTHDSHPTETRHPLPPPPTPPPRTHGTPLAELTRDAPRTAQSLEDQRLAGDALSARSDVRRRGDELLRLLRDRHARRALFLRRARQAELRRSAGDDRLHLAR